MKGNYVIGMTKSILDLNGVKPRNLQNDFIRMVSCMNFNEEISHGVSLVYNDQIITRVNGWLNQAKIDSSKILLWKAEGDDSIDWDKINLEKEDNVNDNKSGADKKHAIAKYGRDSFESLLKSSIEYEFKMIDVTKFNPFPSAKWDYVGQF